MKKAVFFDIDGTLWDRYMVIPDSTREAIQILRKNNVYTFICSGRTLAFIQNPKLLELGFDGILAGCGTYVSFKDQEILCETIAPDRTKNVLEIMKRYHMPVVLEGKKYQYVEEKQFEGDPFITMLKKEVGENLLSIVENDMRWEISKFSVALTNKDYKSALDELKDEYDFLVHGDIVAEGVPKGYSKASGIKVICEKLGIANENTYAFGDSVNDLEMLRYVAHGVAMGDGMEEAKQVADYVTTGLHEDGIYNACKYFNLI